MTFRALRHATGVGYAALAALILAALAAVLRARAPVVAGTPSTPPASSLASLTPLQNRTPDRSPSLRLLVATDLDGTLEPCGCTREQLGGLDRMAAALDNERSAALGSLFVSAGDLFFAPSAASGSEPTVQEQWRAETLAQILGRLQLDAAGLGARDLLRGHARLATLADQAGFSWVSSGLLLERAASQHLANSEAMATAMLEPVQSSKLRDIGPVRVGIVGMLARPEAGWPRGVRGPDDPVAATLAEIRKLRSEHADLIIALTQADASAQAQLAQPEAADFIITSGAEAPGAQKMRAAWALNAGHMGQGFLVVDVWLKQAGGAFVQASADGALEQNRFQVRSRELPAKSERAPAVRALLDDLAKRVNEYNQRTYAGVAPPAVPSGQAGYVGSRPCAACHTAEYLWWTRSPHARAYESLVQQNKQFYLECVGCHVTGYGKVGGSTVSQVGELKNVGCESCHGPGSTHIADARPPHRFIRRSVAAPICVGCHDAEHSHSFDYEQYVAALTARGHGLPLGQ